MSFSRKMKHEAQINEMLDHVFRELEEPWMNDDDKRALRSESLSAMAKRGVTKEAMSAAIEEGVARGHSVERQLAMIREFCCEP
jgi:hypothetical protein